LEYIIYDGIDSRTLGVYMASIGKSSQLLNMTPPSRSVTDSVAGRHGEYVIERTYGVRDIDVPLYFTRTDPTTLGVISRWLGKLGTCDLILSTEPYKVYKATVEQGIGLNVYNPKQAIVSIVFTCYNPFAYSNFNTATLGLLEYNSGLNYNSGLVYSSGVNEYTKLAFWANPVIYHGGNVDLAMPKIEIKGAIGTENTITTITHWTDSAKNVIKDRLVIKGLNNQIIDCEKLETRFTSNGLLNTNVEGTYFKLYGAGDMVGIDFGGVTINSTSSATLSARNSPSANLVGKAINIFDEEGDSNFQVIVQAQNVNEITFSTNNGLTVGKTYTYKAIDYSKGLNYFTIDAGGGSTASVTKVSFDFKFVYL
jgi:predicted phage tail component-like protein